MTNAVFPAISESVPAQVADEIRRAPTFDMQARCFAVTDGALQECDGTQAVRQWIALMLRQEPDKTPIYGMSGSPVGVSRALIGQRLPSGFVWAELERGIRDTLALCPAIRAADRFTFTRTKRGVEVRFITYLHTGQSLEVLEHVASE